VEFSAAATLRSSYGILKEQGIRLVFMQGTRGQTRQSCTDREIQGAVRLGDPRTAPLICYFI
jgi:hypothetical protein